MWNAQRTSFEMMSSGTVCLLRHQSALVQTLLSLEVSKRRQRSEMVLNEL